MKRKINNTSIALGRQVADSIRKKNVDNNSLSSVDDVLETNIHVNYFKRRKRSVLITNSEELNLTVDESQQDVNDEAVIYPRSSSSSSSAEENQNQISDLFIDIEPTDHDDRDSLSEDDDDDDNDDNDDISENMSDNNRIDDQASDCDSNSGSDRSSKPSSNKSSSVKAVEKENRFLHRTIPSFNIQTISLYFLQNLLELGVSKIVADPMESFTKAFSNICGNNNISDKVQAQIFNLFNNQYGDKLQLPVKLLNNRSNNNVFSSSIYNDNCSLMSNITVKLTNMNIRMDLKRYIIAKSINRIVHIDICEGDCFVYSGNNNLLQTKIKTLY